MIDLHKMSRSEYDEYFEVALPHLAAEMMRTGNLNETDAIALARKSFDALLPDGDPDTPGQFLYNVLDGDEKVGVLWFGIKRDRSEPEAYVWDINIEPDHRSKGYGRQVMTALENEARKLGLARISFNVYEHNEGARRFYEQLGYCSISRSMTKEL